MTHRRYIFRNIEKNKRLPSFIEKTTSPPAKMWPIFNEKFSNRIILYLKLLNYEKQNMAILLDTFRASAIHIYKYWLGVLSQFSMKYMNIIGAA